MTTTAEDVLRGGAEWLVDPRRNEADVLALIECIAAQTGQKIEYVRSAIGILMNAKGEVLILHRPKHHRSFPDSFCLPGGGFESEDENVEGTVTRETLQETGQSTVVSVLHSIRYTTIPERRRIYEVAIFHLQLKGTPTDEITLSDEHDAYMWVDPHEIRNATTVIPFAGSITKEVIVGLAKK